MQKENASTSKGSPLYQDLLLYWHILREWNRSKREAVEMTVEQALQGLNYVISKHPNTPLARKAATLIEAIVTKQDDPFVDQEWEKEEAVSTSSDHQGTLAC